MSFKHYEKEFDIKMSAIKISDAISHSQMVRLKSCVDDVASSAYLMGRDFERSQLQLKALRFPELVKELTALMNDANNQRYRMIDFSEDFRSSWEHIVDKCLGLICELKSYGPVEIQNKESK